MKKKYCYIFHFAPRRGRGEEREFGRDQVVFLEAYFKDFKDFIDIKYQQYAKPMAKHITKKYIERFY